jgi:hypothetical protein
VAAIREIPAEDTRENDHRSYDDKHDGRAFCLSAKGCLIAVKVPFRRVVNVASSERAVEIGDQVGLILDADR